jgi:hypothetical protein
LCAKPISTVEDLQNSNGLSKEQVLAATTLINNAIAENQDFALLILKSYMLLKQKFFK